MARKLLIWVVCAVALFSYFAGQQIVALGLGGLFLYLLYADFKKATAEEAAETQVDLNLGYKLEKLSFTSTPGQKVIFGILIIWMSQLVLKFTYEAKADQPAPSICLLCNHK